MQILRLIIIAIVCTMLLIPIAGYSSNIIKNGPLLIAVSFGLSYVAIPAFLLYIWPAPKGKAAKSMQDALWDGDLVTIHWEIHEAAQIEEFEDEGLHFLFTVEPGKTLCLSGQYLYRPVERGSFPSEQVRIFMQKSSGVIYGIEPVGQRLESWIVYGPIAETRTAPGLMLEDGRLYAKSIAEIAAQLDLKLKTAEIADTNAN
jgi:hypothetical protein